MPPSIRVIRREAEQNHNVPMIPEIHSPRRVSLTGPVFMLGSKSIKSGIVVLRSRRLQFICPDSAADIPPVKTPPDASRAGGLVMRHRLRIEAHGTDCGERAGVVGDIDGVRQKELCPALGGVHFNGQNHGRSD
jgi:hypothetical protein